MDGILGDESEEHREALPRTPKCSIPLKRCVTAKNEHSSPLPFLFTYTDFSLPSFHFRFSLFHLISTLLPSLSFVM